MSLIHTPILADGSQSLLLPRGATLLIQLGDIGDVVLTMPAVQVLRRQLPGQALVMCVREHARELAEDCPWVDGVISVDKRRRRVRDELAYQAKFLMDLRKFRFRTAIDLRTGSRGAIAAFLSGAPCRIGRFAKGGPFWRNRIFTHLVRPENELLQYAARHNINILAPFGLPWNDPVLSLAIPEPRKKQAEAILREAGIPGNRPMAAVHPFSLWGYKEWQTEGWACLIHWLSIRKGYSVVVTGSPSERSRGQALTKGLTGRAFNLAGKTSIGQLPAVLKRCSFLVGVDTAALHIAAAVGLPTVGIFGPTSPVCWAPRGNRHCVVTKGMWCQPCREKGCGGIEKSRCLDELKAEEVICRVEGHLKRIGILADPDRASRDLSQ